MPDKYQQILEEYEIEYTKKMVELQEKNRRKIRLLYYLAVIILILFTYLMFNIDIFE